MVNSIHESLFIRGRRGPGILPEFIETTAELVGIVGRTDRRSGEIIQPVTTAEIVEHLQAQGLSAEFTLGERAVRDVVAELETMGFLDTWIESRGRDGRVKQIETAFNPHWVRDVLSRYLETTEQVDADALLAEPGDTQ